jgi:menaquinone-dependent protoporphyrinogen oxidase
LRDFVAANARLLNARPSAFFSVNLTARKPGKDRADTNPYVRKFLAQTRWQARCIDVFAGRLDYPSYRWLDRQIIRFIMLVTGGPTDPTAVVEYTDWARVAAFGRRVAAL